MKVYGRRTTIKILFSSGIRALENLQKLGRFLRRCDKDGVIKDK